MTTTGLVKRVVLTGGPCGGKSTLQAMLSDVFSNLGWKVYRVPETATTLLSGGITFSELNPEQAYQFQKDLLLVMLRMEETFFNLAQSEAQHGHPVIVLCDRGCMDASAYIAKSEWTRILEDIESTEVELRDQRYDAVVHLMTAAYGAEQFYSSESNHVRSEGVDLARQLDDLCKKAWVGHPYYDIIDNSTGFEEKCHRVVGSLLQRLGLEDKRYGNNIRKHKMLVDPAFRWPDGLSTPYQDFGVEHTFLHTVDSTQIRIRRRTQNNVSHFSYTHRLRDDLERRRPLQPREYESLRNQADLSRVPIVKKRRCFLWQSNYYQLDIFQSPSWVEGLIILEAYLPNTSSTVLPTFIEVKKEITGEKEYSLYEIALKREEGDAHLTANVQS